MLFRASVDGPAGGDVDDLDAKFGELLSGRQGPQDLKDKVDPQGRLTVTTFRFGDQELPEWHVEGGAGEVERDTAVASSLLVELEDRSKAATVKARKKGKTTARARGDLSQMDSEEDQEPEAKLGRAFIELVSKKGPSVGAAHSANYTSGDSDLLEFAGMIGISITTSHLEGSLLMECASMPSACL